LKILIAGLGSIGRRHLHNLATLAQSEFPGLQITLYRTGKSTLPDDELVGYPVEYDLQSALAQDPQAVVIANPTASHLTVAIPAARQGCHLLVEKPVSHNLANVDELQQAIEASGSRVLVGYHFRFHPGLRRIAAWLEKDSIGRVISVRAHWGEYLPGWHPWEDYRQGYSARQDLGGGVILTLSHPLDYLLWLFGDVRHIWALSDHMSDLDIDVEDTAEIGMRFQSGVIASLHLDYNQQPAAHTLEIVGTQGTLRWDAISGDAALFTTQNEERNWQRFPLPAGFERNDLFLAEMRHFLQVASGQVEPFCNLQDGVAALRLALAAHEAATTGSRIEI
jgi:predicted dehydrogenase